MSEKIPKGWKWVKLGEVAEVVGGFAFKSQHFGKHGTPVVKIKDIKPPYIDVEELEKVDTSFYNDKNLKKYYIEKNDFVLAMTGATIGKIGILKRDLKLLINQRVAKIVPKDIVNKAFIYYSINNNTFQQFIQNNIDSNSAQENISSQSIGRFTILLPPLSEQKAIAEVLSSIDDKIVLLHRQNKTLEEMAMTLFRQWFIEPTKDGLPEGWEECTLNDLCLKIASGGTPSTKIKEYYDGHINWYSTKELNDGFLFESEKKITLQGLENSSANFFPKGTIVMAIYAAPTVGRLGILTNEASFNQAACGLVPNTEVCSTEFLYLYLKSERENLNIMASGSAQQNLNVNKIKTYPTIKVPKNIMIRFNKIVIPIFHKIENNSYQIQTLEKLRDTLLPKLMSGEVRVKV